MREWKEEKKREQQKRSWLKDLYKGNNYLSITNIPFESIRKHMFCKYDLIDTIGDIMCKSFISGWAHIIHSYHLISKRLKYLLKLLESFQPSLHLNLYLHLSIHMKYANSETLLFLFKFMYVFHTIAKFTSQSEPIQNKPKRKWKTNTNFSLITNFGFYIVIESHYSCHRIHLMVWILFNHDCIDTLLNSIANWIDKIACNDVIKWRVNRMDWKEISSFDRPLYLNFWHSSKGNQFTLVNEKMFAVNWKCVCWMSFHRFGFGQRFKIV